LLYNAVDIVGSRLSKDRIVNEQGRKMLSIYNSMDLRICNGRFGPVSSHYTYKECSVVDFVVVSPSLLKELLRFEVNNFDPIISDVHYVLSFSLHNTVFANRLSDPKNNNVINEMDKTSTYQCDQFDTKDTRVKWNASMSRHVCVCFDKDKLVYSKRSNRITQFSQIIYY
jgi:hypothetical protein